MDNLKNFLDERVVRFNEPGFIADDPVQFPRRFSDKRDIEIASLLVSTISWGKRPMILRNAERLLGLLGNEPYNFVADGDFTTVPDGNIHRTFFSRHLLYYLNGLRSLYRRYGSLEDFAHACGACSAEAPSWHLAEALSCVLADANAACRHSTGGPDRCLPSKPSTSALKRFNMALRWLVRDDGIVDIGCWSAIRPPQLFIPLDVHVGNVSRGIGLLTRTQNDRRAAEELTCALRRLRPDDPVVYDFALFGLGESGEFDGEIVPPDGFTASNCI